MESQNWILQSAGKQHCCYGSKANGKGVIKFAPSKGKQFFAMIRPNIDDIISFRSGKKKT